MHLHAHNFWILAEGVGKWDGKVTNPSNPVRRDTHLMGPGSDDAPFYSVIEFEADNPGVWPFHCHLVAHVAAGMYINVIVSSHTLNPVMEPLLTWNLFRNDRI